MDPNPLYSEDINMIQQEIKAAESDSLDIKYQLLKHYLLNLILYDNLETADRKESPITGMLTRLSILLEKLRVMQKKIECQSTRRIVDRQMMRNKDDTKRKPQSTTPRLKYKRNAERLAKRIQVEHDPNIDVKKSKSNKFK